MKRVKMYITSFLLFFVMLLNNEAKVQAEEMETYFPAENAFSSVQNVMHISAENVGDTMILGEDENGTLSVTLVSYESSSNARSSEQEDVAVFLFQYTNILGIKSDAYKVTTTCYWTKDGTNSKINSFHGVYEIIKSGFSCEWIDSSYTIGNCWLDLKASYGSGYMRTRFHAFLFAVEEPILTLDCYNFT